MKNNIPETIGIIMDGNRRWAKAKKLPSWKGHYEGFRKLEEAVSWAGEFGVKNLIVYAFSTENWKRSVKEVSEIKKILYLGLTKKIKDLNAKGAELRFIGNKDHFGGEIKKLISKAEMTVVKNKKLNLIIALSYGGRDEIIRAVGKVRGKKIDEREFSKLLDTSGIPDPCVIVRTGGEMRMSNFLLWQSAYSELFFTKTLWPDFSKKEFAEILREFSDRERRNGK